MSAEMEDPHRIADELLVLNERVRQNEASEVERERWVLLREVLLDSRDNGVAEAKVINRKTP